MKRMFKIQLFDNSLQFVCLSSINKPEYRIQFNNTVIEQMELKKLGSSNQDLQF